MQVHLDDHSAPNDKRSASNILWKCNTYELFFLGAARRGCQGDSLSVPYSGVALVPEPSLGNAEETVARLQDIL